MKNILRTIALIVAAAVCAVSCKEDRIDLYSGPEAMNLSFEEFELYGSYETEANISFLALPSTQTSYQFTVYATIIGEPSASQRTLKLMVVEPSEDIEDYPAEKGVDFDFPTEVAIPANATKVSFQITVYSANTTDIYETFLATIAVDPSGDFTAGPSPVVSATFSAIFPTEWYSSSGNMNMGYTGYMMGRCTPDKYRFIYEYYGTIDLVRWALGWMDYSGDVFINELNAALDQYEITYGHRLQEYYDGNFVDMLFSPAT